jgi:hypothetical protein
MNIELKPVVFKISNRGELEYYGKVIEVRNEFRFLSNEQKRDTLITLINWANDELSNINNNKE